MRCRFHMFAFAVLFVTVPSVVAGDEVIKELTAERTEALLSSLQIEYKKVPAKKEGILYYDFQRGGQNVRLYWYGGKDLMLDVVFSKMSLDEINAWNVRAKFSRACLHKDDKGEFTALEANLDLGGGVSEGAVRQFIRVFEDETKAFARFANSTTIDDTILDKISADRLEDVFKSLKIAFKKSEVKGGAVAYDFESGNHKLRLINFGGEDLMIDAHFKKLPLEEVNGYNLKRKFIRCVAYKVEGKEYTALEANLDCVGGVPESVVRHFIREFDEEVRNFTQFLDKK